MTTKRRTSPLRTVLVLLLLVALSWGLSRVQYRPLSDHGPTWAIKSWNTK